MKCKLETICLLSASLAKIAGVRFHHETVKCDEMVVCHDNTGHGT